MQVNEPIKRSDQREASFSQVLESAGRQAGGSAINKTAWREREQEVGGPLSLARWREADWIATRSSKC